jgi:lysophospholipase L1-like esterase
VGPYSGFEDVQFLACAGDVIEQVSSQVQQIEGHPDLITLSGGGNDARFSDVLISCGNPFGLCEGGFLEHNALIDGLYEPLVELYSAAKDRADAANADVIVFAYPQLFGNELLNGCTDDLGYSHSDRVWIRSLVSRMNDVIQEAGDDAGVTVIQLSGRAPDGEDPIEERAFDGNEICSSVPFINGIVFEESKFFHPNATGYAEMTTLLADAWEELRD